MTTKSEMTSPEKTARTAIRRSRRTFCRRRYTQRRSSITIRYTGYWCTDMCIKPPGWSAICWYVEVTRKAKTACTAVQKEIVTRAESRMKSLIRRLSGAVPSVPLRQAR